MRVKCLTQEHNTMTWPGLEPRLLDLEITATMRPTHLSSTSDRMNNQPQINILFSDKLGKVLVITALHHFGFAQR